MKLVKSEVASIPELVGMSKRAFDSDIQVGALEIGGPPEYDSIPWHIEMMYKNHLFVAVDREKIVGGAILFPDESNGVLYIGRIFVDPSEFEHGYGTSIMNKIEEMHSNITIFRLETPPWNTRTNQFYKKIGYKEKNRTNEDVFYEKIMGYTLEAPTVALPKSEACNADELLSHLDLLHTTDLGVQRIRRNLHLSTRDVVAWCREQIISPNALITRKGKNWYITVACCEITVNAHSYTIITAHSKTFGNQL